MTAIIEKVYQRMQVGESGKIYIASDFFDLGSYETIRRSLNRLVESGKIRRILKGLYLFPKYLPLIDEYAEPSMDEIARALARKYRWDIVPAGNTALNLLGLSTQVPAQDFYLSNGRYASFEFGERSLNFKHTNNANLSDMTEKTALVIQGLKALGKDRIGKKEIQKIRQQLTEKEKEDLLEGGKATTAWIYAILRDICEVK